MPETAEYAVSDIQDLATRYSLLVVVVRSRPQIPRQNRRVRIDAAIAQEGPIAACVLDQLRVAHGGEDLGALPGFGENAAEGVGDEGVAEELDPFSAGFVLVPDAIGRRDEDSVGDGMCALDRAPRVLLCLPELLLLGGVPAD